jgi:hypothetical protein
MSIPIGYGGISMAEVLTPAECDFMRAKLRQVIMLHEKGYNINSILRALRRQEAGYYNKYNYQKMATCLYCGKESPTARDKKFCDISCRGKYFRRLKNDSCTTG